MKRFVNYLLALGAVAALGAVMAYFAGFMHEKIDPTPAKVSTAAPDGAGTVSVRAITEPLVATQTGTVRAKSEVVIAARITAGVTAVYVHAGDQVDKGQVLLELDSRALSARVEQTREAIAAAAARAEDAGRSFERRQSLFERGAVSRAEFDSAQVTLRTAQADLEQARRLRDEAATALSYTVIRAPASGRVIERYADPGDTAVPAQPLVRIYDPLVMRIEAHVRESLAGTLSPGTRLQAHIDALARTLDVIVDEVVPLAEPGSRSFLVKGIIKSDGQLFPGMFGRLAIPAGEVRRLYVPAAAVSQVGQLDYVEVRTAAGPARRFVRLGTVTDGGQVEIRAGLDEGEQVYLGG